MIFLFFIYFIKLMENKKRKVETELENPKKKYQILMKMLLLDLELFQIFIINFT